MRRNYFNKGKRMRVGYVFITLALILTVFSGCGGVSPENEIDKLKKENVDIHTKYNGLIVKAKQRIDFLQAENAKLKKAGPRYEPQQRRLEEYNLPGIQERDGELVVLMTADILFDPGSAKLKNSAKGTLDRLGSALNDEMFRDKAVRIEGHTDSDPIKRAKKRYSDNWELAASRAMAVTDYLIRYGKVDPSKRTIYSASYSMYHPVAPNDSKGSKAKNRRVEVDVIMGKL